MVPVGALRSCRGTGGLAPRRDLALDGLVGRVEGVALGRERQVGRGLGEGQRPLRQADELHGVARGQRLRQGLRIGQAHVLAREAHQPPGDVEGILAAGEHAAEPVEAGLRVAVAQALVQGADEVVMLVAGLVVAHGAMLDEPLEVVHVHRVRRLSRVALTLFLDRRRHGVEQAERLAGIALRQLGEGGEGPLADRHVPVGEAVRARESTLEKGHQVVGRQRLEDEQTHAREQGRVQLEAGILGGRADERDGAAFDPGQQRILLGLVEAVDLVEEQHRPAPRRAQQPFRLRHHRFQFAGADPHRAVFQEPGGGVLGHQARQGGLAAAGRAPEQERRQAVALQERPERTSGVEQARVADQIVEALRTQAVGQRSPGPVGQVGRPVAGRARVAVVVSPGIEEVGTHGADSSASPPGRKRGLVAPGRSARIDARRHRR